MSQRSAVCAASQHLSSRPLWRAVGLAALALLSSAPTTSAHVRWFVPSPARPIDPADVFSGVTILTFVAIGATLALAWVAARLAVRWRLNARARALALPLLRRFAVDLPRPADMYPWIPAVLALHTAVLLFVRGVERQLFVPNLALPYTLIPCPPGCWRWARSWWPSAWWAGLRSAH